MFCQCQIMDMAQEFIRYKQKLIFEQEIGKQIKIFDANDKNKMKIFQSAQTFLSQSLLGSNKTPSYNSLMKDKECQLRKYGSCIVAQTVVESTHQDAGNKAFGILAGYIFGKNDRNVKIQMTAPVSEYEVDSGKYMVQFMMPSQWTLDTLPKPLDSRVAIRKIPQKTMFAIRYNGGWSQGLYQQQLQKLKKQLTSKNMRVKAGSQPIWARYNSPMAPAPIRTNQIMYQVDA